MTHATTPLRVAAVMDTGIVSGPGRQLVAVAGALKAHDVELSVITFQRAGRPPSAFPEFARQRGVRVHVVPESGRLDVRSIRDVGELLTSERIDIIQTHSYKPALVARLIAPRRGLPWIGFFHGITWEDRKVRLYNWLDGHLLRAADHVVVVAPDQRERFARHHRVTVLPNAVIPVTPSPADIAALDATLPGGPRLAVIGRLSYEKGIDVFLHALARMVAAGFAGSALIVGDGPERGALEDLSKTLGLASTVTFLGQRSDVHAIYRAIDVLVMSSRTEGMPNVLLEALAADCPAVATAVGAIPHMLDVPHSGMVVPSESPPALADAMTRILAEGRSAVAREARAVVAARYSLEARAAAHRTLYDEVLAPRSEAVMRSAR